jgi:hypothetical protein
VPGRFASIENIRFATIVRHVVQVHARVVCAVRCEFAADASAKDFLGPRRHSACKVDWLAGDAAPLEWRTRQIKAVPWRTKHVFQANVASHAVDHEHFANLQYRRSVPHFWTQ